MVLYVPFDVVDFILCSIPFCSAVCFVLTIHISWETYSDFHSVITCATSSYFWQTSTLFMITVYPIMAWYHQSLLHVPMLTKTEQCCPGCIIVSQWIRIVFVVITNGNFLQFTALNCLEFETVVIHTYIHIHIYIYIYIYISPVYQHFIKILLNSGCELCVT